MFTTVLHFPLYSYHFAWPANTATSHLLMLVHVHAKHEGRHLQFEARNSRGDVNLS